MMPCAHHVVTCGADTSSRDHVQVTCGADTSSRAHTVVSPYAMAPKRHSQTLWTWFRHTRHGFTIRDGASAPSINIMDMVSPYALASAPSTNIMYMVSPYAMAHQRHPQTLWTWFRHTQWRLSAIHKHYGHGFAL